MMGGILSSSWYIVVPEAAYVLFLGLHYGLPGGAALLGLYAIMLSLFPKAVMILVGAVMAIHLAVYFVKAFIGDRIADSKYPDDSGEYRGVPRLSGESKSVQDDLDRMKEK